MVPIDLPSICSWKPRFHPNCGTLFTTTRPSGGLACVTVLVEIAHTKARIRRALLPKLRLDLMGDITHKTRFFPAPDVDKLTKIVYLRTSSAILDSDIRRANPNWKGHRGLHSSALFASGKQFLCALRWRNRSCS